MAPLDQDTFSRLAGVHVEAWQELLASTAAVATLPLRTVQHLAGWVESPHGVDRGAEAERAVEALTRALGAERAARRADARRWEADAQRWEAELLAKSALVAELRQAYAQLEQQGEGLVARALTDQWLALYRTLEPLLTQLPIARHAVAEGREVAAGDLFALLAPLDQALMEAGFRAIGQVGEALPFDPQTHQIARGPAPAPGEPVTVRHVGYRLGDQLLRRARVAKSAD